MIRELFLSCQALPAQRAPPDMSDSQVMLACFIAVGNKSWQAVAERVTVMQREVWR